MELRELRAFVAVAEQGGVARAASTLYLSPSSVSNAIASLEAELGAKLFRRVARGMVLTDAGQAVLAPARRALEDVAAAEVAAATGHGVLQGRVSVVPGRIFLVPVIAVVARFRAAFPQVVITIREPENGRVIAEMVRKGEVDCGVMGDDSVPPDLLHTPIGVQTEGVVVAARHPLAGRQSISFSDLDGVDMIVPPAGSPFRPMFDRLCRAAGIMARVAAESDHLQTMLELARHGVGVTIVPIESAATVAGDGLEVIPLAPTMSRRMSLVTRRREPLSPAAEAFWEFVRREVPDERT